MIRKLLIALLSITCVAGGAAGVAACSPERNSGTGGNGSGSPTHFVKPDTANDSYLEYELNEDGDGYIVKGIGSETGTVITIPDEYKDETLNEKALPVTAIAEEAFSNEATSEVTRKITNVAIGGNVEEIGNGAFAGCVALKSITIPDTVRRTGTGVFANCTGLIIVNIGRGITRLENNMFMNCTSLKKIAIPANITVIGDNAFEGCSGLTSLEMGSGVRTIGKYSFAKCTGLKNLELGTQNLYTIGDYAFFNCSGLVSAAITGASIYEIGFSAFSQCSNLQSITIPFVGHRRFESLQAFLTASSNGTTPVYEEFTNEDTGAKDNYSITNFGFIFGARDYTDNNTVQWRGRYIPASLTYVKVVGGYAIGAFAFVQCNCLETIEVQNVQYLALQCFAQIDLKKLILSDKSVKTIGRNIFGDGSVGRADPDSGVVNNDYGLYYYGNATEWGQIEKDSQNSGLTSATMYYYSGARPAAGSKTKYWHYVNGVVTPW